MFKDRYSFVERREFAERMRNIHGNKVIPVVVESTDHVIDKNKFLVPAELTVGQFLYLIRRRTHMKPTEAIFVFVRCSVLPPTNATIGELFADYHDADGILYVTCSKENTFG